jgi:polyisoprenoid-binding protein YceI
MWGSLEGRRWLALLSPAMVLVLAIPGFIPRSNAAAATTIDPSHTRLEFAVEAIGWRRTTGRFTDFSGRIAVDLERPDASSVAFRVAAKSVDVGSDAFDKYLRGDAFFDVAHYPDITFTSTAVLKLDERHARVAGDLTLRGVARPFTVDVEVAPSPDPRRLHLRATGVVHRREYNMSAGFPAISNDVDLIITTDAEANGS